MLVHLTRANVVAFAAAFTLGALVNSFLTVARAADAGVKPGVMNINELLNRETLAFHSPGGWVQPLTSSPSASLAFIKQTTVAAHSHSGSDEFVYVLRGTGVATIANRSQQVRSGDLLIIPRGVIHAFKVSKGTVDLLAFFSPPKDYRDVHWASPMPQRR
jgi:quercetin dioxygenase-like cupin family protein